MDGQLQDLFITDPAAWAVQRGFSPQAINRWMQDSVSRPLGEVGSAQSAELLARLGDLSEAGGISLTVVGRDDARAGLCLQRGRLGIPQVQG